MKTLLLIFTSIFFFAMVAVVPAMWHKPHVSFNHNKNLWNEIFEEQSCKDTLYRENKNPDTTTIKKTTQPKFVQAYQEDTTFRQTVENNSIITNVEYINPIFKPKTLVVTKIDTKGISFESFYKVPILSTYRIDHEGNVRIKKRWALKIVLTSAFLAATYFVIKKQLKT